jgi:4-amino-4-deoxy-L-arabinose transferase-like glycosyltransferase
LPRWTAPAALLAATLLRLLLAAITPLAPDEAYYWVWSRALAAGYLDHPPMVALWIRAGTGLAGPGALGVRLLGPLATALGSVLLARAGEDLLPGSGVGVAAAVLLNATLLFGVGAITMTPDTPLLLFWTFALFALARLHATGRGEWWLVAGAAAGLALDSKYTAALIAPAVLLWLVAVPTMRPWLRRPQPWAGATLALLLFAPVIWWNAGHGFASFLRQGGRAGDWSPERGMQFLGELFGGQLALATPLIGVLMVAGMAVATRQAWRRDGAWALLAAFSLLPAVVLLQHALGDRVQANWPAIGYPAAAIAAAGLGARWMPWRAPAVALGVAVTALVVLQGLCGLLALPARLDPTLARLGGWPALADEVAQAATRAHAGYVAVSNYGDAAEMARLLPPALPVLAVDERWALFDLPDATPSIDGRPGLLLRPGRYDDPPAASDWAEIAPLPSLSRARGEAIAADYRLYRVVGRAGAEPIVTLPRP